MWIADVCDANEYQDGMPWQLRALTDTSTQAVRDTHREALSWALAVTGQLRDGDPHTPCGRGPCALGNDHRGDCRC